jgi:hypothetical protein
MSSLANWTSAGNFSPSSGFRFNTVFMNGNNLAISSGLDSTITIFIYYSSNNGITWNQASCADDPNFSQSSRIIDSYMNGSNAIAVGSASSAYSGIIYYSSNGGQTWLTTSSNWSSAGPFKSCVINNSGFAIAVAIIGAVGTNLIYYSITSGSSWILSTASDNFVNIRGFYSCSMVGSNAIAVGTNNFSTIGTIYFSVDNGSSWNPSTSIDNFSNVSVFDSCAMVGSNAIAVGSNNTGETIYFSVDNGSSWNPSTSTDNFSNATKLISCAMVGSNAIAVGTSKTGTSGNGCIYYSSDSGANWICCSINIGSNGIAESCSMSNSNAVCVIQTGFNSLIGYSSNSGATWNFIPYNNESLNDSFISGINALVVGYYNSGSSTSNYGTIYYSPSASVVCFNEDTQILTDSGYKLVQDLRKGDLVKTALHGFVPIEMIAKKDFYNPASSERIKDQLYILTNENYPDVFEPLIITGCHSILVDGFKDDEQREKTIEVLGKIYVTNEKYRLPACVDERCEIYEKKGNCTIYHFALENENYYYNYGIYANGLLVETCSIRYLKELSNMIELV